MRKTIYTLNIGDYAPAIRALTFPLIEAYAQKIGAEFCVITDRKFPEWPVTYEKLQIFSLGRGGLCVGEPGPNDWNIFVDADTLISPEMFDVTNHLHKDTVCHNGRDMAGIRWKYDEYFRRDGRNVGSCNWFTVGSDWCLDLWRPLDDLTLEDAIQRINVTIGERNSGFCETSHLIDDFTLSRNIARFGLKFTTVTDICGGLGWKTPDGRGTSPYLWHKYTISNDHKVREMLALLSTPNGQLAFAETGQMVRGHDGTPMVHTADGRDVPPCGMGWGIMSGKDVSEFKAKWGVK